ncbi:DUF4145 domain-containing protein [Zobellia barbeyronii]|uniref:DUF4145 domain-containing protein n=1 Tax=Zobellia barbeyronii TaxID=2748009 RepID=A0ABS5WC77_9FLAO|nr:DUF4145 domain-containing protein [Zobellia barbeyronii]MBT2160513.1 DUF4145 domain-containing protein [Zobellia barbeyronii]
MLIECTNCNIHLEAETIGEFLSAYSDDPIDSAKYSLFKCPKCFNPILTEQTMDFDNVDYQLAFGNIKILYPNSEFHLNPIIPEKLRDSLKESIKCFRANSYTATAIMCRRTIEGFCFLKGVKDKNLAKSIEKLKTNGIINEQLYEWANELRLVGNEAAHNIEIEFSVVDSRDILDFTIAILDFTYSFKDKFDRFKERQSK